MDRTVRDQVVNIIAEQAVIDPASVSLDASLEDLGIDSLGLVEAVFAIEERFDIQIPLNANDTARSEFDISSVASIVSAVEDLVVGQDA